MTNRSLSIINDSQQLARSMQLRSNVINVIELIGKQQAFVNSTEKQVEFSEVMRQIGTENANYVWPFPTSFARLPAEMRWYLIQIKSAGYYSFSFQYTFSIISEVYARLNVFDTTVVNPEIGRVNRFFPQLLPVSDKGQVTWTQYIDQDEIVSISLNTAANLSVIPNYQMHSPALTIVQLTQFYTNTIGYKSTIAQNTATQTIATATPTAFVGDTIPGAASTIKTTYYTGTWMNEGGGNQLNGITSAYNSIIVSRRDAGSYYIEAQITITGSTAVGIGGRYVMLYDGLSVLASKFIDPLNSGDRHIHISTVAYLLLGGTISAQILQTSGVNQTTVAALCHLTVVRLGD